MFIVCIYALLVFFFFKQKTAYEMRISDWSSDVCSSDLPIPGGCGDDLDANAQPRSCASNRRFEPEALVPAGEAAGGLAGEMGGADQRVGVAVAFEEGAASAAGEGAVEVGAHGQLRIARLERRVDQVAAEAGAAAPQIGRAHV